MATATLQHPTTDTVDNQATDPGAAPLLVATDATSGSDAAVRAARAIARTTGQRVRLIAVSPSVPVSTTELAAPIVSDAERRQETEIAIIEQMMRLGVADFWAEADEGRRWTLDVVVGDPAAMIANAARRYGAELIIMGLGGHQLFDRILGDEMVLKVLRLGRTPVLAVTPGFHALPRHALAAVDFTASSVRALAVAAPLVASGGRISLVHVKNPKSDQASWRGPDSPYVGTVGRSFDRLIADTAVQPGVRFERHVTAGHPGEQLLLLSDSTAPDLIIAGSHGHNFLTRVLIGSVSTKLLRHSRRSVLIAPPVDGPDYVDELAEEHGRFHFYEWAERLEEFTRQNVGRRAILEVIDPELGAQLEQKGVAFQGASYDPRDGHVYLMFGEGAVHLTRSITRVHAIQVLKEPSGRDVLLRVAHGHGQTLLTLER